MPDKKKDNRNAFFSREELKKDLKRRTLKSALSKVSANGLSAVLTLGSTIVLARLLMPEDFGLIAMVVSVTDLARYLMELGLGVATVQREEITHEEVSALFWINVGIGAILAVAVACLSPALAWFYSDSRLLNICLTLSIIFLFRGLTVQHRSLLERQMRFGYLGAINVVSNLLGICVAVTMALNGFGVWSLVWRELVNASSYAAGAWLFCRWIPGRPRLNSGVRSSVRFGAHLSGNSIVAYITQNLDRVLIGRFFGATSVGLYAKAFQLATMPIEQIRMLFWDVGFSPLSALQSDPERYRRFYGRLLSVVTFISIPVLVFIALRSEDVIRLLFGEAWLSAVPFLRVFAIAGFVKPILFTCQLAMISCGKSKRYLNWGMISGSCVVIAYAVGIAWGALGVAYAYAIANFFVLIFMLLYGLKDTPISVFLVLRTIAFPVTSSVGAGLVLVLLTSSMPSSVSINVGISLLIVGSAYIGIWLSVPTGRQRLAEYWSYSAQLLVRK
jgi:O-antigen/teichoic acid export membrane protein